jgi:hypothetical protein
MRPLRDERFVYVNETLRARYQAILDEPLPGRWVDLINALNDKERAIAELQSARTVPSNIQR